MITDTETDVRTILDGRDCHWCSDGTLEKATYKGNNAVVCDECNTPAVQLW